MPDTGGMIEGVVVHEVVAETGVVVDGDGGGEVSTELTEDDVGGPDGTGIVAMLVVDDGTEVVEVTWVIWTVEVVVVDKISVVLQGVVLDGGVTIGVGTGVVLVSQEVSLCLRPLGVARAGPMAAKRKNMASIVMTFGILAVEAMADLR